jgi:hypothetical protein
VPNHLCVYCTSYVCFLGEKGYIYECTCGTFVLCMCVCVFEVNKVIHTSALVEPSFYVCVCVSEVNKVIHTSALVEPCVCIVHHMCVS